MIRSFSLSLLLVALPSFAQSDALQSTEVTANANADTAAEKIGTEVDVYLASVKQTVALAERGELGRIKRDDLAALRKNATRIDDLLRGRSDARELSLHQRIDLYTAQSEFEAIAKNQRENAQICTQVSRPGTRLTSTQCMTVAEHERARRAARETADRIIRQPSCISEGSASSC